MRQKVKYGLLGIVALCSLGVVAYWPDIRNVMELRDYLAIYEPDSIDQNFRSLYAQSPSVRIPRQGDVAQLAEHPLPDALPETFTVDGEALNLRQFLGDMHTTGLAILLDGRLVHEEYHRGNSQQSIVIQMSVSKSMASFLIGVAIDEGFIKSVDDLVTDYAPTLINTAYDGVTIKNVLEMSSGVKWAEDLRRLDSELIQSILAFRTGSLDEFTASVEREFEPGTHNRYSTIDTHALGMVLRGATERPYEQYFAEKLWARLGAEGDAHFLVDATGQPVVYGGANIVLRDMLRFGQLYLDGGRNLNGEQLVSENWIKTSTQPDVPRLMPMVDNPESGSAFGYKYQWWVPLEPDGDDYSAIGIYGQFIYVNPKRRVVIAKSGTYLDYPIDGGIKNHLTLAAFQSIARHLSSKQLSAENGVAQNSP
ncbi:MAG: serine hydrolase [Pseudomonadota bacterium]